MTFHRGPFGRAAAVTGAFVLATGCLPEDVSEMGGTIVEDSSTGPGTTGPQLPTTDAPDPTTTAEPDTTTGGPEPPAAYDQWLVVDLPGAVCGNGSPYKIFVNYHEGARDLLIALEPGGACWDYETCAGKVALGAANPNGIPDTHLMNGLNEYLTPMIRRELEGPTRDWNYVFIPYCTGDVHTGNNVVTYADPSGQEPDLEYHHNGHNNVMAASEWMARQFPEIDRLFVTGCSAGGAGSIINYYFFRNTLNAQRGYLMDDSGPIFPSTGKSGPLHDKIRKSWDVDSVLSTLPPEFPIAGDFGALNTHVADLFPNDRLSTVFFQRDYNYSRYSYERFYPDMTKEKILSYWAEDTELLVDLYETRPNLAYYLPYWRGLNDSHCVSIIAYDDTDIEEQGVDLGDFIGELLDDEQPLMSYIESVQPGEDD